MDRVADGRGSLADTLQGTARPRIGRDPNPVHRRSDGPRERLERSGDRPPGRHRRTPEFCEEAGRQFVSTIGHRSRWSNRSRRRGRTVVVRQRPTVSGTHDRADARLRAPVGRAGPAGSTIVRCQHCEGARQRATCGASAFSTAVGASGEHHARTRERQRARRWGTRPQRCVPVLEPLVPTRPCPLLGRRSDTGCHRRTVRHRALRWCTAPGARPIETRNGYSLQRAADRRRRSAPIGSGVEYSVPAAEVREAAPNRHRDPDSREAIGRTARRRRRTGVRGRSILSGRPLRR